MQTTTYHVQNGGLPLPCFPILLFLPVLSSITHCNAIAAESWQNVFFRHSRQPAVRQYRHGRTGAFFNFFRQLYICVFG